MSTGYHHEDEVQQRAFDAQLMRRLLVFVRPYRAWMITAIALLLFSALVSNCTPLLIMRAVDFAIGNGERIALASDGIPVEPVLLQQWKALCEADLALLWWITWVLAGLMLLEAVVRYAQFLIVAFVGQKTMMEMRVALFEHLQRLSLKFIDRNPLGRLMTRVTNDIEKIQQTVVTGVVQVASDLFTIVVVLIFMLAVDWRLTLVTLIPMPFIFATSMIFRKYARRSFMEIRRKIAAVNAYLQENVNGMRIVQLFGREEQHFATFAERNAIHRDEWLRQVRNFAIYFPTIEFFGSLATVFIILYCGHRYIQLGEIVSGEASIGTVVAFTMLAERFYGPIRALADRYNLLLEAMASSERVFQLLDTPEEIADKPDAVKVEALEGHIEFDGVWFSYDDDPEEGAENWVLQDVSFSVAPGERVAIVGHTGAGKTTIISLLNRLYDIQRGTIRIDGVDIRDYEQVALRRKIGVVLQDVFLFSGSVEKNIRLRDNDMSEAWVQDCARYVNAARFIEKLPGGYQYDVGERGCNLSSGQRQLLAFARTLAHRPAILVLDEATSSIDTETEELIQEAIAKLMEDKIAIAPDAAQSHRTSIVIAHRLSTIQHADRIIVMHHGEIREEGTHQELLRKDDLYRNLYELQYLESAQ